MIKGELYINGQDAWLTWGAFLDDASISALMTPAATKEFVKNNSRLEHGTRYITTNPKLKERDLTLNLQIFAPTRAEFYTRYNNFCTQVLATGLLNITTRFQPDVCYKCIYENCTQWKQYTGKIAKFSLKLKEMNPNDREIDGGEE